MRYNTIVAFEDARSYSFPVSGTFSASNKRISLEDAEALIVSLKAAGKRVSMLSGSFDVFHAGHVHFIEQARNAADALIVLLNSDTSVRSYKGPDRPIVPEDDRALLLGALGAVDAVLLFDESTPLTVLETLHPDFYCNGSDYGPDCIEKEIVERNGGRVYIIERIPGSSTALIDRIRAAHQP